MLGFQWQGSIFIDQVLPFGLRSPARICQRVTNAVTFICRWAKYILVNYFDNFGGVDVPGRATEAYVFGGRMLEQLGVVESFEKACAPTTAMIFGGILIDTVRM